MGKLAPWMEQTFEAGTVERLQRLFPRVDVLRCAEQVAERHRVNPYRNPNAYLVGWVKREQERLTGSAGAEVAPLPASNREEYAEAARLLAEVLAPPGVYETPREAGMEVASKLPRCNGAASRAVLDAVLAVLSVAGSWEELLPNRDIPF